MNTKIKIVLSLSVLFAVLATVGNFFSQYAVHYQSPVTIHMSAPIYWVRRAMAYNITIVKQADGNVSPLTPVQQYICNKFGQTACPTALAIARAESNYNCNEININGNSSVDFGIYQENSVHLNKQFTFADLASCQSQVDAAYKLYKAQGWQPWTTYVTGAYKKYLIN